MFCVGPKKEQDLVRFYSFSKNQNKKNSRTATFNRFILLGLDREQECVALFTENIDHTKVVLQYFPQMKPGTKLHVLNPRLRGFIGDTNTALVTTSQPLIPYDIHCPMTNYPPKIFTENEDYSCFNFVTKNLQIGNATFIKNVCNGVLCDGNGNKNEPCGCISAANRAIGLHCDLYCPEFELDRVEVPISQYCSVSLGLQVVSEKFDVMALAPHDVDDRIRELVSTQNETGFRVIGWCRAPKESDQAISDAKLMHVVSCFPENGLSEQSKLLRLKPSSLVFENNEDCAIALPHCD